MKKLTPPFRLGKKQTRAILDSSGNELVVFPKHREEYAKAFLEFLNGPHCKLFDEPKSETMTCHADEDGFTHAACASMPSCDTCSAYRK